MGQRARGSVVKVGVIVQAKKARTEQKGQLSVDGKGQGKPAVPSSRAGDPQGSASACRIPLATAPMKGTQGTEAPGQDMHADARRLVPGRGETSGVPGHPCAAGGSVPGGLVAYADSDDDSDHEPRL